MKILLSGNHNPHFFNSVQCREAALRELGHEVVFFNTRGYWFPGRIRRMWPWLQRREDRRLGSDFVRLNRKEKPDLCLLIGGDIAEQALKEVSAMGVRIAFWTTDPPVDPEVIALPVPYADYVFCSGTEAIDIVQGAFPRRDSVWLPFACAPEVHKPAELTESEKRQYSHQLVFVGAYYPNRRKLFEALARFDIRIWGPGWNKVKAGSPLSGKAEHRHVNYDMWTRIYTAADIVLMVHFQDGKTPCHQASPKLFEAMACGAFVLCDAQEDACALFEDGKHLAFFKDKDELLVKAAYYLSHPEERRRIAEEGRREVLAHHTYRARMETLLGIVTGGDADE